MRVVVRMPFDALWLRLPGVRLGMRRVVGGGRRVVLLGRLLVGSCRASTLLLAASRCRWCCGLSGWGRLAIAVLLDQAAWVEPSRQRTRLLRLEPRPPLHIIPTRHPTIRRQPHRFLRPRTQPVPLMRRGHILRRAHVKLACLISGDLVNGSDPQSELSGFLARYAACISTANSSSAATAIWPRT